jgi:hypothetical protein
LQLPECGGEEGRRKKNEGETNSYLKGGKAKNEEQRMMK